MRLNSSPTAHSVLCRSAVCADSVHTALVRAVPRGQSCDSERSPRVSTAEMCECCTLATQHKLHRINLNVSMCYSLLLHSETQSPN